MSDHVITIQSVPGNERYPYYTRCSCGFGGHGRTYEMADFYKRSHQHVHGLTVDPAQKEDPEAVPVISKEPVTEYPELPKPNVDPNLPEPEPDEDESPLAASADAPEVKAPETVTETSESNMEAGQ